MKKTYFQILLLSFLLVNLIFAQDSGIDLFRQRIFRIITNIIRFVFTVLMLAGSAILIFLGIKYIFAKEKVEDLHKSLMYVILGIVLLIISFFVPNLIKNFIETNIQ